MASSRTCAACGAPLADDQRYCLRCGERAVPRGGQLAELLRRAASAPAASAPPPQAPSPAGAAVRPGRGRALGAAALIERLSALGLPSRRVGAVLLLAFLGFGVLLGNAAGSRVDYGLASSAKPLKVVLAPAAASASATTPSEVEASAEPPEAPSEATPEAAGEVPASAPAPTPAPAPKKSEPAPGSQEKQNGPSPSTAAPKLPEIEHVFVIVLSSEPYAAVFGPESGAPYLSRTLERRGELLVRYYAVAHQQLANGIALVSGQGPTQATAANCPVFAPIAPASIDKEEQVAGEGCVYPPTTATLPGQLEVKRLTWRAYVQGLGEAGGPAPCSHPAPGQPDPSAAAASAQPYATFRNPFVYFEGLAASPTCAANDVGFGALSGDLANARRTPSLSYIVPDRCHDASPGPCPGGGPGGLAAADGMLQEVVPKILASRAYKQSGLLVITVDQAPSSGEFADSSSCCGQPQFPNLPPPSGPAAALGPEGGGQVGALLLSPFVKGKTTSQEPYNHFSLLRTIEDVFSLKHIGYAAGAKVEAFEPSLFAAKQADRREGPAAPAAMALKPRPLPARRR